MKAVSSGLVRRLCPCAETTHVGTARSLSNVGRRCYVLPASNPFVSSSPLAAMQRVEGRGRGLYAAERLDAGSVVLTEQPLVAVADPTIESVACDACFRQLPAGGAVPCDGGCGSMYCCAACKAFAIQHAGHEVLCDNTAGLDGWCKEKRMNFPRVAAHMLARSFVAGDNFVSYWEAANLLITLPVTSDTDVLPPVWRESFQLVKGSLSHVMPGSADQFFATVFDLRTYARLMGTLRLNSFKLQCPLGGDGAEQHPHGISPEDMADKQPGNGGGCADSTSSCDSGSGCDSGCSTDADPLANTLSAHRGGTSLYVLASMTNHSCGENQITFTRAE
jgi:hypothetical protein